MRIVGSKLECQSVGQGGHSVSSTATHANSITKVGPTGLREMNAVLDTAIALLHLYLRAVDINYGSKRSVKHHSGVLSGVVRVWIIGGHHPYNFRVRAKGISLPFASTRHGNKWHFAIRRVRDYGKITSRFWDEITLSSSREGAAEEKRYNHEKPHFCN